MSSDLLRSYNDGQVIVCDVLDVLKTHPPRPVDPENRGHAFLMQAFNVPPAHVVRIVLPQSQRPMLLIDPTTLSLYRLVFPQLSPQEMADVFEQYIAQLEVAET